MLVVYLINLDVLCQTKISIVAIMVKHLKSISLLPLPGNYFQQLNHLVTGESNNDYYLQLYSVNFYSTLRYSNLNPVQFGTIERRNFRIYSNWREFKWHKIEVLP